MQLRRSRAAWLALLLALVAGLLLARACAAREFPAAASGNGAAALDAANAAVADAADADDDGAGDAGGAAAAAASPADGASYAERYAADPAGGVISVPPAPLDPSFLPHFNCRKIALIKTHKTGSTTLGSVLFRAAAQQGLRVHPGPHVDSSQAVPPEKRGAFDVVLQHNRRGCLVPGELPRLLAHYASLLGTDDFSVVTTVRHPVARFLSHFYFFAADELERAAADGKPADLAALVHQRGYNNLTACVFGVQQLEEAVALVNSPMFRRVFFIPVEYLHEGVAMLSRRCGWGSGGGNGAGDAALSPASSSSALVPASASATATPPYSPVFLNVNENNGARGDHVRPALRMDHFARSNPSLLRDMAEINSVDLFLYGAALASFRAQLAADAGASLAVAAHVRAAQRRLGSRCSGAPRDWKAAPSLCSWLSLYDTVYLDTVDPQTGLVRWDSVVAGRPLSTLREEAERDVAVLLPAPRPFFVVAGAAVVSAPQTAGGGGGMANALLGGASSPSAFADGAEATPEAIEAWSEALLKAGVQRVYLAHATAAAAPPVAAAAAAAEGGRKTSGGTSDADADAPPFVGGLSEEASSSMPPPPPPPVPPLALSPRTQARAASGEVVVLELGAHGDGGGFGAAASAASAATGNGAATAPGSPATDTTETTTTGPLITLDDDSASSRASEARRAAASRRAAAASAEAAAYAALTAAMRRAASWGLVIGLDERVVLPPGVGGLPWALADAERESPLVAQACAPVLLATDREDAAALVAGGSAAGAAATALRPAAARLSRGVRCAARLANVRALRPHVHAPVQDRAQALCANPPAFWGEGGGGGAQDDEQEPTADAAASLHPFRSGGGGGNGGGGATTAAAAAALGAYVEGYSDKGGGGGAPSASSSSAASSSRGVSREAAAAVHSLKLYGFGTNCVARSLPFSVATADALLAGGGGGDGGGGEEGAAAADAAAVGEVAGEILEAQRDEQQLRLLQRQRHGGSSSSSSSSSADPPSITRRR